MTKKITFALYVIVVIALAVATFVENFAGTPAADKYVYGSGWFVFLWLMLVAFGLFYILKYSTLPKHIPTLAIHFSMVVILLGALLTHLLSHKGIIYLRGDQPTNVVEEQMGDNVPQSETLPFSLRLDRFNVTYHEGTLAPSDYITKFKIIDGAKTLPGEVSMNHIFTYKGIRFYQSSYDTDHLGSYLSVNRDPYGITVTYVGYLMLFVSLIWLLLDPKGTFRQLLHRLSLRKGILVFLFLAGPLSFLTSRSATVIPQETAKKFGQLFINYDNRICPLQTFAYDFTSKIYGSRKYGDVKPEQVVMSWIFYPDEWDAEPIIHVKSSKIRHRFNLNDYACLNDFFKEGYYILGPYIQEYGQGQRDAFHKACAELDERLQIVMELRHGNSLTIFPHEKNPTQVTWFSPVSNLPPSLSRAEAGFIRDLFSLIAAQVQEGQFSSVDHILEKLQLYQVKHGGYSIPTTLQVKSEYIYNTVPFTTILAMSNLTIGLLLFIAIVFFAARPEHAESGKNKKEKLEKSVRIAGRCVSFLIVLSCLCLTFVLALRWIISGSIPLSNGYETMLAVSWFCMLFTIIAVALNARMGTLCAAFGFLVSGFFLLVSHISQMDPAIGPTMPVLNSPMLSVHVSLMMMSYALLSLTFICGLTAIVIAICRPSYLHEALPDSPLMTLQDLSRVFLYPAIVTLGIGVFIGAIWANISWGSYWSWDPKETWALITFMVYAVPLHPHTIPTLKRPMVYHIYIVLAFLVLLMTFFGVNYFLGGMHSYA